MGVSREFFEKQILELLGPLQGVARRLTGNDTDAEDLVADTVVRALRALDTLQSEAAFRSWMFCILNNTFISDCRRANARPRGQNGSVLVPSGVSGSAGVYSADTSADAGAIHATHFLS